MSTVSEDRSVGRTCVKCLQFRPWSAFAKAARESTGHLPRCKTCMNVYMRAAHERRARLGIDPANRTIEKNCTRCAKPMSFPGLLGGAVKFCSLECAFWHRVDVRGPDECWPWKTGLDAHGYGNFRFRDVDYKSHRVSLQLKLGREISSEECAMHSCDNRVCVNPAHLSPGTRGENIQDAHRKGRMSKPPRNPNAKVFTADEIRAIRIERAQGDTQRVVAERHGCSQSIVSNICSRKAWAHIE